MQLDPGARPLAGRRIVVTRARHQAGELVDLLEALGADVVAFPTIRIDGPEDPEPLQRAVRSLSSYDWLVFTSRNGVERFWRVLDAAGGGAEALTGLMVACVGGGTASALEAHGRRADVVPDDQVGEGLLRAMLDTGGVDGARVLLARAAVARDVLPNGLRQHGAIVDDVETYRTLPDTEGAAEMRAELDAGRIDALTFTSPSAVRNFVDSVGYDLGEVVVAVIGPVTGDAARDLGLRVAVTAEDHSVPGLVRALVGAMRSGTP